MNHLPLLIDMLAPMEIIWHPVFDEGKVPEAKAEQNWIKPLWCPAMPEGYGFIGSWKTNWFLDHMDFEDSHRYLLLNDDDWYEPDFFNLLDEHGEGFIICSMKRGEHQPEGSPHPGGVLIACPENMRKGYVGGEQIILTGAIAKNFHLGQGYEGDYEMLSKLLKQFKPRYAPEAYVLFNALEPGRFDKLP